MKRKLPGIIILQSGKPTIEIEGKIYSLKRTYRRLQVAYQVAFCILAVLMILFLPDYLPFPFFVSLGFMILAVLLLWFLLPFLLGLFMPKKSSAYIEK